MIPAEFLDYFNTRGIAFLFPHSAWLSWTYKEEGEQPSLREWIPQIQYVRVS